MTGRRWLGLLEGSAVAACAVLVVPIVLRLAAPPLDLARLLAFALAALAGYLAADLASGLVPWFCDWFFEEETPLLGRVLIHPFREHHRDARAAGVVATNLRPPRPRRFLVHLVLVGAFGLALLSIALSRRAPLGLTALALVIAALLLGGSQVDVGSLEGARYLGLDWFLLNVLVLAMLFVPLEQLFARLPQRVLRPGWTTDLAHFAVSHLLVQVTVLLTPNVRFRFGRLADLIATPQFHHWHHAAEPEAVDKNFAVHLPVIDRLLGTYHMPPGRWPGAYGIAGHPVPGDYARQLLYPFRRG